MEIGNVRTLKPTQADSCTPPRFRVLYVDSNGDDRFFVEAACRRRGVPFDFHFASAAEEAISILESNQNGGSSHLPDLILLEVRLPGDGGPALLKHLRTNPRLSKIPLVVYTDALDPRMLDRARNFGADLIIEKEPSVEIAEKLLKAATELCCKRA